MSKLSAYLGKRGKEIKNIATLGAAGRIAAPVAAIRNNLGTIKNNAKGIGTALGAVGGPGGALLGRAIGGAVQGKARNTGVAPAAAQGAGALQSSQAPSPTSSAPAAPDAFSYFLPDGTPVNGTTQAPPTGTPYRQSEALVPNANGALTSTATGDAANAFRGFTSADGGSFGGANADKADPALWAAVANRDPASLKSALSSSDPALATAASKEIGKLLGMSDTQAQGQQMLATLSPADQGKVKAAFLDSGGMYAPDQAGYDKNRASQQGMYQGAWDRAMASLPGAASGETAVPTPDKVKTVSTDPFAPFGAPALPTEDPVPVGGPPPINIDPANGPGYAPLSAPTGAAPPGGMMPAGGGSAARATLSAGRYGRQGSPFAAKFRQRFKPLGAPANGFTPQTLQQTPSTNVF